MIIDYDISKAEENECPNCFSKREKNQNKCTNCGYIFDFWKDLYEFNKDLKNECQIIVVAPDVGNMENDISYIIEKLSSKELLLIYICN